MLGDESPPKALSCARPTWERECVSFGSLGLRNEGYMSEEPDLA